MSYYTIHGIISGGTSDIIEKASSELPGANANSGVSVEKIEQIENSISNLRAQINKANNIINQYEKLPAQLNALISVVNSIRANTFKLMTTRDYSAELTNVYSTQYINNIFDSRVPLVWDDTNKTLEAVNKDVYSATFIQNIPNINTIPTVFENTSKTVKALRDPIVYSAAVIDEIRTKVPTYHYVKYNGTDTSTAVYNTAYIDGLPIPTSIITTLNSNPRTYDVYSARCINNEIVTKIPNLVNSPADVQEVEKEGYTARYINSLHIPSDILYEFDFHDSSSYNYDDTVNNVYDTYYIDRNVNTNKYVAGNNTRYVESSLMVKLYDDSKHKQELSGKRRIQSYGQTAQTYMFRPTFDALVIEYLQGDFLLNEIGTELMKITNTGAITFKNLVVGDYITTENPTEDIVMVTRDITASTTVKDYFGLSDRHNPYALIQRHVYRDNNLTFNYDIDLIENGVITHELKLNPNFVKTLLPTIVDNTLAVNNAATFNNTLTVTGATTLNDTLTVIGATTLNDKLTVNANEEINGNLCINSFNTKDGLVILTNTHAYILLGKSKSENNCATIRFRDDRTDYLGLGFYGNDDIIKLYTNHNIDVTNGNLNMIQTNAAADQSITFSNNKDFARIRFYNYDGVEEHGALEIATADDGDVPIYVRQYKWKSNNNWNILEHEITLLDENGNTRLPNTTTIKHLEVLDSTANANIVVGDNSSTSGDAGVITFVKDTNNGNKLYIGMTDNNDIVQIMNNGNNDPLVLMNDNTQLIMNGDASTYMGIEVLNSKTNAAADTAILIGSQQNTNKSATIRYRSNASGNALYTGYGYFGNDDIMKIYTNRDVEFNDGNVNLIQNDTAKDQSITFQNGSDFGRIRFYQSALEIATADDGDVPIYVRQYSITGTNNNWGSITHEATLLDASGNTQFPQTITSQHSVIQNNSANANVMLEMLTPNANVTSMVIGKNSSTTNAAARVSYTYNATTPSVGIGFNNNPNLLSINNNGNTYIMNSAMTNGNNIAVSIGKNNVENNFTTHYNYILEPTEQDPEVVLDKSNVTFDFNDSSNILTIDGSQISSVNNIHAPNIDDMAANKVNRSDIVTQIEATDVLNTTSREGAAIVDKIEEIAVLRSDLVDVTTHTLNTSSDEGGSIQYAITHVSTIENNLQVTGTLTTTSDIFCEGTITQTSDRTLKQDIKPLHDTNVLDKINTYSFTFTNDSNRNKHYGVIAQELQELLPELVHENPRTHKLTVDYIEFVPHLINKVQQLDVKNKRQNVAIISLFVLFLAFMMCTILK